MKRIICSLLTVLLVLSLSGCSDDQAVNVSDEIYLPSGGGEDIEYNTVSAEIGTIYKKYYLDGIYENPYTETITADVGGVISKSNLKDGKSVKKGQVLLVINSDELDRQLDEQLLRLNAAKKTLSKLKSDKKADSDEIKSAEYDLEIESNSYDLLQKKLESYTIRAPFKGEIDINTEDADKFKKGMRISEGQKICKMSDPDDETLCGMVYKTPLEDVGFGTSVTVTQGDKKTGGKVTDVVFVDAGEDFSAYYYVIKTSKKVDFNPFDEFETIRISFDVYAKENVVIVPTEAVKTVDERSYVNVMVDGVKMETDVETGITDESHTEITSGLIGGETIILN